MYVYKKNEIHFYMCIYEYIIFLKFPAYLLAGDAF